MKILINATLFLALMTTSLFAADYKGNGKISLYDITSTQELVEGELQYKWRLWTLVGEPVDELVAQWNIHSVDFHNESSEIKKSLKDPDSGSLKYKVCEGSETSGCIPKDIMEKVSILDLKLIGHGHPSGKYPKGYSFDNSMYSYAFDAGVMNKPYASYITAIQNKYGKWSYNTPGSKSWDNCFEGKTENESKQIMKSGVKLFDFRIHKIKFNFNDVKRYIIDRNKKYYKSQIDKEIEEKQGELDYIYVKRQRNGGSFDDPSAELELVEREKVINKMIQDSDSAINKRYASADASLKSEASSKSYLLQATKDGVAARSTGRIPKSYVVKKTEEISERSFGHYTNIESAYAYPFGVFFTSGYTHEDNRLWLKKNEKMLTVKDFFDVDENYYTFDLVELDNNEFLVYTMSRGTHETYFGPDPVIYRVDELGNKIGSYDLVSTKDFNRVFDNSQNFRCWEGTKGEIIIESWTSEGIRDSTIHYTVFSKSGKLIDEFSFDSMKDYRGKYSREMINKSKIKPVPEIKFDYQKGIRFISKTKDQMVGLNYLDNDHERSFDRKTKEIIITNYSRKYGRRDGPIDLYNKVKIRILKPKY